jgi:hypothetical protein
MGGSLSPVRLAVVYVVHLKAGRIYTIDLSSRVFDSFLRLENSKRMVLAEDDDGGGFLDSRIVFRAPVDDYYRVIATSLGGRSVGPYLFRVREGVGLPSLRGRPAPGFPRFPPPPFIGPGPGPGMPPDPNPMDPKKDPAPETVDPYVSMDQNEMKKLLGTVEKQRRSAFDAISTKLDLADKDMSPTDADRIARYLLITISDKNDTELDDALTRLTPFAKSRNLMLALADNIENDKAMQRASEAVVGKLITGQQLLFGKSATWRPSCRKMLLVQALELGLKKKADPPEISDPIRDYYKDQAVLFGMNAKALEKMTQPSQVLTALTKYLADKVASQNLSAENKAFLERVPRQLQAAQFVARNDLEQTVLIQRVWIRVLGMHLEQRTPQNAEAMRQVQQELTDGDLKATSAVEQLRGGEEKILRLWTLAHDLK